MTRRMITSDMFEDEFYMELDLFERNLWVGLIVRCADDQGRSQDNAVIIRSQIFPADEIGPAAIEKGLARFAEKGRILRYQVGGKKLIQIVNWWKHQTPSWAAGSRYPSPDGWTDRIKVHQGTRVVVSNWDKPGGFATADLPTPVPIPLPIDLPTPVPTQVSSPLNESEYESESEMSRAESKETEEPPQPVEEKGRPNIYQIYENEIGPLTPLISDRLDNDVGVYTEAWVIDAIHEAAIHNARNMAYVDTILKRWKAEGRGKMKAGGVHDPRDYISGEFGQYIKH